MRFTYSVDLAGLTEIVEIIVDAVEDLTEPLLRAGGYLRARAKKRIKAGGPGWPALKASTIARKPSMEMVHLLSVMRGKTTRKGSRLRRQGVLKMADQAVRFHEKADLAQKAGRKKGALTWRRKAEEKEDQLDSIARIFGDPLRLGGVDALLKMAEKDLAKRAVARGMGKGMAGRYRVTETSTQMLGGLQYGIKMALVDGGTGVEVVTHPDWSGVHNAGGTVGHGANIKARPFLLLEKADLDRFVEFVGEHVETKLKARQGAGLLGGL